MRAGSALIVNKVRLKQEGKVGRKRNGRALLADDDVDDDDEDELDGS